MVEFTDPHILGPGMAPTPFTAEEIRLGCPAGRTIRLLVEPSDGEPFERVNRFVDCDAEGAMLERWRVGADGAVDGEVGHGRSTWLAFQGHASFPAAITTITADVIELPFGAVPCLRYVIADEDGEATFWFAPAHPGMPVRYESPAPGGGVDRTTMVADDRP